jgi:hypothetical protein
LAVEGRSFVDATSGSAIRRCDLRALHLDANLILELKLTAEEKKDLVAFMRQL